MKTDAELRRVKPVISILWDSFLRHYHDRRHRTRQSS